jgi:hypothetical protein
VATSLEGFKNHSIGLGHRPGTVLSFDRPCEGHRIGRGLRLSSPINLHPKSNNEQTHERNHEEGDRHHWKDLSRVTTIGLAAVDLSSRLHRALPR